MCEKQYLVQYLAVEHLVDFQQGGEHRHGLHPGSDVRQLVVIQVNHFDYAWHLRNGHVLVSIQGRSTVLGYSGHHIKRSL